METLHDASSDLPAPPQPDWIHALPSEAFSAVILMLRAALPLPLVDTAAEWALRDRVAMAAALQPASAAEGRLAVQFVVADAHALACLRLANERARQWEVSRPCKAQAMSLVRESKTALRMRRHLLAERRALAKDVAAAGSAEWVEYAAVSLMAEALAGDVAEDGVAVPAADFRAAAAGVGPVLKSGRASARANSARKRRVETTARFYAKGGRRAS